jgi:hypothetical protein
MLKHLTPIGLWPPHLKCVWILYFKVYEVDQSRAKDGPISLYTGPWRPKGPKKCKWMKTTWQEVDNVSWSTGYCVRPIKKRWVWRKTRGHGNRLKCHWLFKYYNTMVGTQTRTQTYVAVPQHVQFHFTLKVEGPPIAKLDFYFLDG